MLAHRCIHDRRRRSELFAGHDSRWHRINRFVHLVSEVLFLFHWIVHFLVVVFVFDRLRELVVRVLVVRVHDFDVLVFDVLDLDVFVFDRLLLVVAVGVRLDLVKVQERLVDVSVALRDVDDVVVMVSVVVTEELV